MTNPPCEPPTPAQLAADENTPPEQLSQLAKVSEKLARIVAKNPSTPPELLLALSTSGDEIIRQKVAANPNTPTEVLLQLAADFPAEVVQNPVFSLLFLENPNFLNQMPKRALVSILMEDGVPVSFLEWAANAFDRELYLAVSANAKTPKIILENLQNILSRQIRASEAEIIEVVELHVNVAGEMSSGWDEEVSNRLATTSRHQLKGSFITEIAEIGLISEKAIALLPKDEFYYRELLEWIDKPVNIPAPLRFNRNMQGSVAIAANPDTPKKILEELAQDSDWEVRQAIACNPNAPASILEQLGGDKVFTVRQEVAANSSTPVEVLEKLIVDRDWCVRRSAIAHSLQRNSTALQKAIDFYFKKFPSGYNNFILLLHPQTPEQFLKQYSKSLIWLERYAIASNPNTPLATLRILTGDGNRVVRAAAKANLQNRQTEG